MNVFSANALGCGNRLLAIVSVLALLPLGVATSVGAAEPLNASVVRQIQALAAEKESRTLTQRKMDSQLLYALRLSRGQAVAPGVVLQQVGAKTEADGSILVDLDAFVTPALLDFIRQNGGQVLSQTAQFSSIRARVPVALTETLAGRADVRFIQPAVKAFTNVGSITSQGDRTHRADDGRSEFEVTGAGVKVGVLSDSVDYLANAQATGDLPQNVIILPGQGGSGSGEGTAMLEIVHDLAPGAQLYFASGFNGAGSFAQNIIDLRAAGCDVIVDDIGYFNESPFQDGVIARAVNQVTEDGALYFSSAANSGNLKSGTSGTWEGDFVDGGAVGTPVDGKGGVVHSFGTANYNTITQVGYAVTLFWSDPLGASANDYDLYVLNAAGDTIVSSSTTAQTGSQDPYEIAGMSAAGERIVVVRASGEARYLHIDTIRGRLEIGTAGNTKGHAAATNAFGVAAVDAGDSYPNAFSGANVVETFSSDGPRRVFYQADGTPITPDDFLATGGDVRPKPDIAAADGVATVTPGFNPFYGTSAAAPHAAAIAALLLSYNPTLTPVQIRTLLTNTAIDIEAVGYDINAGAGIVMAYEALAVTPPAPKVRLVMVTNTVSGGNGDGVIDFNECVDLSIVITNAGDLDAASAQMILSTTTPGVALMQSRATLPALPVGAFGSNTPAFKVSTAEDFVCGTPIDFTLLIKADRFTLTNTFQIETGRRGELSRFDSFGPVLIPDNSTNGALSPVFVAGVAGALGRVQISAHIPHTFVSDLKLELIAPDGTSCMLATNVGANGRNFGTGCSPDAFRTFFDDGATNLIAAGNAPFLGSYRPQQPLAVFAGKSGTNVNGVWMLRATDGRENDIGMIQCWSLLLYPAVCNDGGGQCPGNDVAVRVSDFPDPVVIGSNLVYTITVTNTWSKLAKGVVMNQTLPSGVAFVSAVSSQGNVGAGNGVVTANLGNLSAGAAATINVTVLPLLAGNLISTISVSSAEPDIQPADNVLTERTIVLTPSSDLEVALSAAPNPTTVNGLLTYTTVVRNNGPASASGVVVSNYLASSMVIMGAGASKGSTIVSGNSVLGLIGALTNGETATLTISAVPTVAGSLNASARVFGGQEDPVLGNNVVSITTVVGQAADLGITLVDQPDPVVVSSNFTYFVTVTNRGPNTATNVTVSQSLPRAGYKVVNLTTSQGSRTIQNGNVLWEVGSLAVGANARMTVVGNSTNFGTLTSIATVSAAQADLSTLDNSASAATVVAAPFINVVAAGATLTSESITPANGAVDIGETVTVQLRLQNIGNVNNTNLVATLQASGGVTPITPSQNYGVLPPGGLPETRAFSFMANGAAGGQVTATLRLQDGPNDLPSVGFTFELPDVHTFANATLIDLAHEGAADPYPSAIIVSGLTGLVNTVTVTLSNANHTYPEDLDVLLVGPGGRKVLLMSDAGGNGALAGTTFTFDAAAAPLPDDAGIVSARYAPADYEPGDAFASPAPAGPYDTALGVFGGMDPNGEWLLYVMDDAGGDVGNIAGGWLLTLTTVQPVNQVADLELAGTAAPLSGQVGANLVYTFTITNAGPDSAAGVAFTNVVPAGAELVSAEASQGSATASGNLVIGSLGALAAGESASVTVVVAPASEGLLTNTATIASSETDLNLNNNVASVGTAVGLPIADVGLLKFASPVAVTVGSNVTFTLTITNHGPEQALQVVMTNTLPTGLNLVSAVTDVGTVVPVNGGILAFLGDFAAGGVANVTLTAKASTVGTWTNIAMAATASSDPNDGNNMAAVVANVVAPAPAVVASGAAVVQESFTPPNGVVDLGETVTVSLALQNTGSAATANLVATLQASGGVTPITSVQTYGALLPGGPIVSRSFSFTASESASDAVTATLQLKDGDRQLSPVTFVFPLPVSASFSNGVAITIPDRGPATAYPSTIEITGVTGLVNNLTVTLRNFSHGFPDDVDVLLVGPTGQKVVLFSDAGAGYSLTNVTLTLDDAALTPVPDASRIASGTYWPVNYEANDVFPAPAPSGSLGAGLVAFNGSDPNGVWSLYVVDDSTGDGGTLLGGWSLSLTVVNPVNAAADLAATLGAAPDVLYEGDEVGYTISVANNGPGIATGVAATDALPSGLRYLSGSAAQGSITASGNTVTWAVGDLMPGASVTALVRATTLAEGNWVNSVSVVAVEMDRNPDNNLAQVSVLVQPTLPPQFVETAIVADHFQSVLQGTPGVFYVIQASTNFTTWQPLTTNLVDSSGRSTFVDAAAASQSPQKYYRAVRLVP